MARKQSTSCPFTLRDPRETAELHEPLTHIYHGGARCVTDSIGYPTPENRSPLDLRVDASNGFIPLWDRNVTLHWRFNDRSLLQYTDPQAVADYVRQLFGEALLAWSSAVPVRFVESHQPWDFEIAVNAQDDCDALRRCTLASAFFPDAGQHQLVLYPQLFSQSRQEQIETMAHELGHVFGLRHFFANTRETDFPSELFGRDEKFSIMNYGAESLLTETDIEDLTQLYSQAWSGSLTQINGTPIHLVRPFSAALVPAPSPALVAQSCAKATV